MLLPSVKLQPAGAAHNTADRACGTASWLRRRMEGHMAHPVHDPTECHKLAFVWPQATKRFRKAATSESGGGQGKAREQVLQQTSMQGTTGRQHILQQARCRAGCRQHGQDSKDGRGPLVMAAPAGSRSVHSAAVGLGLVDTRMPPPSRRSASTAGKLGKLANSLTTQVGWYNDAAPCAWPCVACMQHCHDVHL